MTDQIELSRRSLAGVALGLAATTAAPSLAQSRPRGPSALTTGSWMDQVKAQHRAIDGNFRNLKATTDAQMPRRTALLKQLADNLTAHSVAEEVVLYPAIAMKNDVPKSDELYMEQAHAKVILAELDKMPKRGPEFMTRLTALETAIKEHVADEESNAYPRLMQAASAAENATMTADFRMHFNKHIV